MIPETVDEVYVAQRIRAAVRTLTDAIAAIPPLPAQVVCISLCSHAVNTGGPTIRTKIACTKNISGKVLTVLGAAASSEAAGTGADVKIGSRSLLASAFSCAAGATLYTKSPASGATIGVDEQVDLYLGGTVDGSIVHVDLWCEVQ